MADIWVLSQSVADLSTLVRADAITYLSASREKVSGARLETAHTVLLAHRAEQGRDLPDNFHVAFLAKLAQARVQAETSEEDLVLMARLDSQGAWNWTVLPVTELGAS